jgi:hypothetical protein
MNFFTKYSPVQLYGVVTPQSLLFEYYIEYLCHMDLFLHRLKNKFLFKFQIFIFFKTLKKVQ